LGAEKKKLRRRVHSEFAEDAQRTLRRGESPQEHSDESLCHESGYR
jgi:hypothetical protein